MTRVGGDIGEGRPFLGWFGVDADRLGSFLSYLTLEAKVQR